MQIQEEFECGKSANTTAMAHFKRKYSQGHIKFTDKKIGEKPYFSQT